MYFLYYIIEKTFSRRQTFFPCFQQIAWVHLLQFYFRWNIGIDTEEDVCRMGRAVSGILRNNTTLTIENKSRIVYLGEMPQNYVN